MTKFIVLSFAFLGWAFYVLSGGSDFAPESRPQTAAAPASAEPVDLASDGSDPVKENEVSRSENDVLLTTLELPVIAQPASLAELVAEQAVAAPDAPEFTSLSEPQPQLRSLSEPAPAGADLRVVAGDLVNMRDGPGTDFGVVTKVAGGTLAEVIEVDATGWARIRLVDTDQTGWMAERLLAGG